MLGRRAARHLARPRAASQPRRLALGAVAARRRLVLAGAVGAVAVAGVPGAASAGTIAYEGDVLVLRAAPGEANSLTLSGELDGHVAISDGGAAHAFPAGRCTQDDPGYPIQCETPAALRAELGDGNDGAVVSHTAPAGLAVELRGEDGDDDLKAIDGRTRATFDGGAGDDVVRSEEGDDALVGGPGNDTLLGNRGADRLQGGDGDDTLRGDAGDGAFPDLLDGGPGVDVVDDWASDGPPASQPPVAVTLDGVADDGRPGEHDDVRDVERLFVFVAGSYAMGDGADVVEVFTPADAGPTTIAGGGGDDRLTGGSGPHTIDGGPGADRVEGGYGHDVLTGGPGRDELYGDKTAAHCGGNGQSCPIPFGDDTIEARDGEADRVDCGIGDDRAVVDAVDSVVDCEVVDRGTGADAGGPGSGSGGRRATSGGRGGAGGNGAGRGGAGTGGAGGGAGPRLTVATQPLPRALRDGLPVRLSGLPRGNVTVRARLGRQVVASGRARVSSTGKASATLRFTPAARRQLSRRASVRLTVVAGSARRTVTLRRGRARASAAAADARAATLRRVDYAVTIEGRLQYNRADVTPTEDGDETMQEDQAVAFRTEIPRLSFHGDVAEDSSGALGTAQGIRGSLHAQNPTGGSMRCEGSEVLDTNGGGIDATWTGNANVLRTRVLEGVTVRMATCAPAGGPYDARFESWNLAVGDGPFDATFELPAARIGEARIVQPLQRTVTGAQCPGFNEETTLCSLTWEATVTFVRTGEQDEQAGGDDLLIPISAPPAAGGRAVPPSADGPAPPARDGFDSDELLVPLVAQARVAPSGATVTLPVRCPQGCVGTATVSLAGSAARSAAARRSPPLARVRFRVAPGAEARTVAIRIPRRSRAAVRRAGGVRIALAVKPTGAARIERTVRVSARRP